MSRGPADPLPPEQFEALLRQKAPGFGLDLDASRFEGLSRYLAELDRWRRRVNLTGDLSGEELADHALESLVASSLIAPREKVADIGSGAGFPGMPLAIARPDLSVALVEPRGKRAAFLRHVCRDLGLSNVTVIEGRIEEVGGQTFGIATTRAVGGFGIWVGGAAFLRPSGALLAWTTDPAAVAGELPGFELERAIPVPGSKKRAVAALRRRS